MGRFASRACKWTFAAAALLALTGCGNTGDITGKVTLDGAPLAGGVVTVYDSQQQNKSGSIMADGSFTVPGVPIGPATLTVETTPPQPPAINRKGPEKELWGKYTKIPLKYKDKNTSGFNKEIKRGKQEIDLALVGEPGDAGAPGK
jgi:hypothetical protein